MKKFIGIVSALILCLSLCACGDSSSAPLSVYAPDGAPAISLSKMIRDSYEGADFHVVPPADIGTYVMKGDADLAIMPTNAAANLVSKGADIAMLGVTNFGSLYLVGKGAEVTELSDLEGKVVYSIGQGNVPDLVFRYLLRAAEITYRFAESAQEGVVSLANVKEGAEFIGGLTAGKMQYGVISEPAATVAQNKAGAARLLDIQKMYEDLTDSTHGYPQAALVVKKSLLETRQKDVEAFVTAFEKGVTWAETNASDALEAIKSAGSTTVAMLSPAIAKGCNLGFKKALAAKEELLAFYAALDGVKEEGETPIGSGMPSDDFFLNLPADTSNTAA